MSCVEGREKWDASLLSQGVLWWMPKHRKGQNGNYCRCRKSCCYDYEDSDLLGVYSTIFIRMHSLKW